MRLINWNISIHNWNIEKALKNILSHTPDILCIQELPERGIDYLKKIPGYELVYCFDNKTDKISRTAFLAILTRYKILTTGTYDYGQYALTPLMEKLFGGKQGKSLYVDVDINGKVRRIHTLHLTWPVRPGIRIAEFSRFLDVAKPGNTELVCGDLNTFGKFKNNFLAYFLFGYNRQDLFTNEKNIFKDFFQKFEWQNPFEGTVSPTWPWRFSRAQLDYILVPQNMIVKNKLLLKKSYGSDHHPQMVDLE